MHWHYSREGKTGLRAWWHFASRSCFHIEASWWTSHCHVSARSTDDGWTLSIALPPLAIWLCFDGFRLWQPTRLVTYQDRPMRVPEQRTAQIGIHDWTIRLEPWGRSMEWRSADPWWVRGVSFDLRLILGHQHYTKDIIRADMPLVIPMPEGVYHGTATFERCTWKRPRWFGMTRLYTSVNVPKGIPFAGKGENSWDCGDDGLYGYSVEGHDMEKAAAHGVESVLKSRRRYGRPSEQAIREALA